MEAMTVYLLHFEEPYKHARHYLGYSKHVDIRLDQHAQGRGVPLMRAVHRAGIAWCLARTWEGDWGLEKYLRRQHHGPRFCPFCRQDRQSVEEHPVSTPTNKALTHCEKYGHSWKEGTATGYDVCTHVSYVQGKTVRCSAVRRHTEATSLTKPLAAAHKVSPRKTVIQQQALWEVPHGKEVHGNL
ncbi:MAG TPA: hypothetical protein VKV40_08080 [Ktedonobacteraceae bacterium]|nr:hypothetical protein [Ktedonobacteraceae bacterium]